MNSPARGTWSVAVPKAGPRNLNGDRGLRAKEAGVEAGRPDGIEVRQGSPTELANAAAAWFERHAAREQRGVRALLRKLFA
jgi:hypothetical protein